MDAPEHAQVLVVEALRSERHPRDTAGAIVREPATLDGAGIRFQCDFHIRWKEGEPPDTAQQGRNGLWRKQARGSTAEKDRPDRALAKPTALLFEVLQQKFDIAPFRHSPFSRV